jgi:hypothetical protein
MASSSTGGRSLALKDPLPGTDLAGMARHGDPTCPICQADVPLAGDEQAGDEVACTYCGAPCRLVGGKDHEELELEEDF